MPDQETIPGFSVDGSIPGHDGRRYNSIEVYVNDLDDTGGIRDHEDEDAPIAGHCIQIVANGIASFTAIEARVIAARLLDLANRMEAGR